MLSVFNTGHSICAYIGLVYFILILFIALFTNPKIGFFFYFIFVARLEIAKVFSLKLYIHIYRVFANDVLIDGDTHA